MVRSKTQIETEVAVVLPTGMAQDLQSEAVDPELPKKRDRIWYVLISETEVIPPSGTHKMDWERRISHFRLEWAFTKSHARHLARLAESKGHRIIDIVQAKTHILNKFRGLK